MLAKYRRTLGVLCVPGRTMMQSSPPLDGRGRTGSEGMRVCVCMCVFTKRSAYSDFSQRSSQRVKFYTPNLRAFSVSGNCGILPSVNGLFFLPFLQVNFEMFCSLRPARSCCIERKSDFWKDLSLLHALARCHMALKEEMSLGPEWEESLGATWSHGSLFSQNWEHVLPTRAEYNQVSISVDGQQHTLTNQWGIYENLNPATDNHSLTFWLYEFTHSEYFM